MVNVLNCIGIPDDDRVEVAFNDGTLRNGQFHFYGNNAFIEQLKSKKLELQTLVLGGNKQNNSVPLKKFDMVFNSICDPDANKKTLLLLEQFIKGGGFPAINHPVFVQNSSRNKVYERCKNIQNLIVPKTIRIEPNSLNSAKNTIEQNGINLPFLMRPVSGHGGRNMIKVESSDEWELLERFAFDGSAYYVSEFVDYRSDDGLYRKSRFIVIDGKVYPRHHIMSKGWKIHAHTRSELIEKEQHYLDEERNFLKTYGGEIDTQCAAIYEQLGLDLFGIDCHIYPDGKMLLFEANACMRYFGTKQNNYVDDYTSKIKYGIEQLILNTANEVMV